MVKDQRAGGQRDPCEFEAKIVVDREAPVLPCRVMDISEQGAKLQVAGDIHLPDVFSVRLPVLEEIDDERSVCLRWRNGDLIGVKFVG
jgi:hypothetical protein